MIGAWQGRPPVLVVAGAPGLSLEPWRELLARSPLVVAADGGARLALAAGRMPDLVVGDGDSLADEDWAAAAAREASSPPFDRHPVNKDETDLELALMRAALLAPIDAPIWVLGAWGGRIDHSLANLCLLAHPDLAGREVCLLDGDQRVWLLQGEAEQRIEGRSGDTVSLIPFGGAARVARTMGLRWTLADSVLAFGPARGVSNRMTGPTALVALAEGRLACIHIAQEGEA
ncbi:MAG: thiamine diphosphokinase [Anaerolineae bacterium]